VPTGNFGDVYAGYVAHRLGLPVDRLVVATNVNDILVRTFATGDYELRDVVATTSPSMDIQVSSNFERLLFEAYDRDAKQVAALMGSLAQSRRFAVSSHALKEMRGLFSADRAGEAESAATIRAWMREAGYCADPHTAVALAVAEKETRDPAVPMVVLSTAHPAKFPDAVAAACGITPALPDWLADLTQRSERVSVLPADQAAVERFVLSASRAAREGAAA
jgi:threonine synthase